MIGSGIVLMFSNSIYGIYIAPLQGNCSEALPAQAQAMVFVVKTQMVACSFS